MARADDYNSASTQFFIVGNTFTGAADSNYAAFGWLLEELKDGKVSYTQEERNNTMTEDGYKVLYDYDCLDKIMSLNVQNNANDGAPVQTVEIVEARVLEDKVKITESKYIR